MKELEKIITKGIELRLQYQYEQAVVLFNQIIENQSLTELLKTKEESTEKNN